MVYLMDSIVLGTAQVEGKTISRPTEAEWRVQPHNVVSTHVHVGQISTAHPLCANS